jgi:excisionase family DNA binding protein
MPQSTPVSTPPRRELLTINHACERASVSRRTRYNWIMAGKVEWCRTVGGPRRIYADTLFVLYDDPPKDPPKDDHLHPAA